MVVDEIKTLRRMQHLVLIREENEKTGNGDRAAELDAEYALCAKSLSPSTAALQRALAAQDRLFVSPLAKGNCSCCNMRLSTGVLQHVLAKDRLTTCPACGRILYVPDVKQTGVRALEPDPKFPLSRFSSVKLTSAKLKAATKEDAIIELCALLAKEKIVSDVDAVATVALDREKTLTTAVGGGLAFPHVRGVEEGDLTFAVGVSPAGIDWDGDGKRVHLVFFTVLPVIASAFYLKLLAALAKTFEDGEQLPFILAATDAKTLWRELNKAARVAVKQIT